MMLPKEVIKLRWKLTKLFSRLIFYLRTYNKLISPQNDYKNISPQDQVVIFLPIDVTFTDITKLKILDN